MLGIFRPSDQIQKQIANSGANSLYEGYNLLKDAEQINDMAWKRMNNIRPPDGLNEAHDAFLEALLSRSLGDAVLAESLNTSDLQNSVTSCERDRTSYKMLQRSVISGIAKIVARAAKLGIQDNYFIRSANSGSGR